MTANTAEKNVTFKSINFPWLHHPSKSDNPVVIALSDRLAWAKTKGDVPLWPNGPTPEQYVQGFIRTPGMGSYVLMAGQAMSRLGQIVGMFDSLEWQEVVLTSTGAPGHKYYQAVVEVGTIYEPYESVIPLDHIQNQDLENVRVRRGPHGLELYKLNHSGPAFTRIISAITDGDGLVTWHPGVIMPRVTLANATVKLA
jgi:hypothetical protein